MDAFWAAVLSAGVIGFLLGLLVPAAMALRQEWQWVTARKGPGS